MQLFNFWLQTVHSWRKWKPNTTPLSIRNERLYSLQNSTDRVRVSLSPCNLFTHILQSRGPWWPWVAHLRKREPNANDFFWSRSYKHHQYSDHIWWNILGWNVAIFTTKSWPSVLLFYPLLPIGVDKILIKSGKFFGFLFNLIGI